MATDLEKPSDSPKLTRVEAWDLLKHQDNLVHTRLQWFAVSQAFLFTAYATSQAQGNSSGRILGLLIPWLGIFGAVAVIASLSVGIYAYWKLRKLTGGGMTKVAWVAGFTPAILPSIFLIGWVIVLCGHRQLN